MKKEENITIIGSVVDVKDEGEETAETYQNGLSIEIAQAIDKEEDKNNN